MYDGYTEAFLHATFQLLWNFGAQASITIQCEEIKAWVQITSSLGSPNLQSLHILPDICLANSPMLHQPPTMAPMAPQSTHIMMPTMVVLTPTPEVKVQGSLNETGQGQQITEEDWISCQLILFHKQAR